MFNSALNNALTRANSPEISDWGSPDYSAGVSVTTTANQTYTCPTDGYIIISIYGYNVMTKLTYTSSLDPNGSETFYSGAAPSSTTLPRIYFEYRVQKDEILTCKSASGSPECTFYPLKGV